MEYIEHPQEFLAGKSPKRIQTVRPPKQSWKGRARCFRLFDRNLTPSDIGPRKCGVSRRTLYRYYEDYKLLRAKRIVAYKVAREKREEEEERLAKQRMEERQAVLWRSGMDAIRSRNRII